MSAALRGWAIATAAGRTVPLTDRVRALAPGSRPEIKFDTWAPPSTERRLSHGQGKLK